MKRNFLKLLAIAIIPLFLAVSCSKDDENDPLTKSEAVEILSSTSEQMTSTMDEVMQTEAMKAMDYFDLLYGDTQNPDIELKQTAQKLILVAGQPSLTKQFPTIQKAAKEEVTDTPFGNYGTYTWNFTLLDWDYVAEPTDVLVFNFPSDNTQDENNAELVLSNVSTIVSQEDEVLTSINIALDVNEVNALTVSYALTLDAENNFEDLSLTIDMPPFFLSASISFTNNNAGVLLQLSHQFKKEGISIMSSSIQAQFAEFEIPNIFQEDDGTEPVEDDFSMPLAVEGFIQMGSVKATLDLDIYSYLQAPSPQDVDEYANDNLKIKIYKYPAGNSIAYVKWHYNITEDILEAFLVFSNGEEEPVVNYFPMFNFME